VPAVIGFVLVLAAIVAGPKLFLRHVGSPQLPAATDEQPLVPPVPKQEAPPPQARASNDYTSTLAEEERNSKAPVAVPAIIHPETIREEETNTVARVPVGAAAHGTVAHQEMPEILDSARHTIRGTVRVSVKVDVDRSGDVEDAQLESSGPSKYFARAALNAAQLWKFEPPKAGGQGVLSSWTLHFKFTRDETTAVPVQEMP